MGNWRIDLRGIGPERNENNSGDVELLVQEFMTKLENADHTIHTGYLEFIDERRQLIPSLRDLIDG